MENMQHITVAAKWGGGQKHVAIGTPGEVSIVDFFLVYAVVSAIKSARKYT